MPTVGTTGSRGHLTSNTLKVYDTSYRASYGERVQGEGEITFNSIKVCSHKNKNKQSFYTEH